VNHSKRAVSSIHSPEKTVREVEDDVSEVREYTYEWHEGAEAYLRALRRVVEEKMDVSLSSYWENQEDGGED